MGNLVFYSEEDVKNFTFYKFPKALFSEPKYRGLSDAAKILYMIFYDRLMLSIDNRYFDENGIVFIYFTINQVIAELGWSRDKVKRAMHCLEDNDLIVLERESAGLAYRIYVTKLVIEEKKELEEPQKGVGSKRAQGGIKISPGVGSKRAPNKTNNIKTNKTDSYMRARAREKNKFHNFNQRSYDMPALEKALLSKQSSQEGDSS